MVSQTVLYEDDVNNNNGFLVDICVMRLANIMIVKKTMMVYIDHVTC